MIIILWFGIMHGIYSDINININVINILELLNRLIKHICVMKLNSQQNINYVKW